MSNKRSTTHRLLQTIRIASQTLFFCLFLYLLLRTHFSGREIIGPVERFFHFDPLIGLIAIISLRALLSSFLWALATIALTIAFGRYVCGWICPFGTVLQFFSFWFKKLKWHAPRPAGHRLLYLKYAILIFVLTASLFTLDLAGYFDPLSFLYRSFVAAVLPAFSIAAESAQSILPNAGFGSLNESLRQSLQSLTINRTFHQGLFIGLIFVVVIFLNIYRERFWCRYLCPTGALLGLLSRWNLVKVKVDSDTCTQCNLCTLHCQTQATPFPNKDWQPRECIYCYSCAAKCPTAAITLPLGLSPSANAPVSVARRKWVFSAMTGIAIAPLFRISASKRASARLIRPPGALPEPRFLAACIKCGECMKVCPTNALQPAFNQAGPEGLWTPVLVPKIGYCEYYCSLCTQICPTGAIQELTIKQKTKVRIGSAWINKNRCIPYSSGQPCIVCEEKCPTTPKAIAMIDTGMILPDGSVAYQAAPVVNFEVCIGCGICETQCPVSDEPAIYCTSMGESRSQAPGDFADMISARWQ